MIISCYDNNHGNTFEAGSLYHHHQSIENERKDTLHRRGTGGIQTLILQKLDKARKEYESLRADVMNSDGNDTTDTSPTFKVLEEGHPRSQKKEA